MNKLLTVILILIFLMCLLAVPAMWQLIHLQDPKIALLNELIFASIVLGAAAASLIKNMTRKSGAEEKRLNAWQAQDAKLISEIKSDREKQLEAKIATLETALKASLKKN